MRVSISAIPLNSLSVGERPGGRGVVAIASAKGLFCVPTLNFLRPSFLSFFIFSPPPGASISAIPLNSLSVGERLTGTLES